MCKQSLDEMSLESFHKELDLIQGCISRMAHNSFMQKNWMAVFFTAIIVAGLGLDNDLVEKSWFLMLLLLLLVLFVILIFWRLDAFFLCTERKYRKMYEWVVKARMANSVERMYDLNPHNYKVDNFFCVMFSKTLWPFYLLPLLCILGFLAYLILCKIEHIFEIIDLPC